ncbi:MAG: hypothetical protein IH937_04420 [Acidobacteria bacterium]|nr:hypothetical protein [Acidobacteriota bacterium]
MKLFFRPINFLLLAGNLLLASNSSVGMTSAQASSQADSRSPFETLSQIVQADSIRIKDEWEGYGPFSPISAFWDLHRSQDGFSGTATFRAHTHYSLYFSRPDLEGKVLTDTVDILVPAGNVTSFLSRLSRVRLFKGEYVPSIPRIASYPSISIEIEVGPETITFFTRSQGKEHIPWGVTIQGETYVVVSSDVPAGALEQHLEPHLKREVLKELLNTVK